MKTRVVRHKIKNTLHYRHQTKTKMSKYLRQQRERIQLEYQHQVENAEAQGKKIVYNNQKEAAMECIRHFQNGKLLVLLIAQPGTGKTGTLLEIFKQIATHIDDELCVDSKNIYTISGMNDTDWADQLREKMIDSFKPNIYHRGVLKKRGDEISKIRNGLIASDECHIASGKNMTVSKVIKSSGLMDYRVAMERNVKLLEISATPDAIAWDIKSWGEKAAVVKVKPGPSYKGFDVMISENRIRKAPSFSKYSDVQAWVKMFDDRYKNVGKKYFPVRVKNHDAMGFIRTAIVEFGWSEMSHDSNTRVDDIDKLMERAPEKHTIIFIKEFWRASKRLVRLHVGGSYECIPKTRNVSTASQSLIGRFCDNFEYEGDEINPELRPIHFGDRESIESYINWFNNDCDFSKANYKSTNIKSVNGYVTAKPSKVHETNMNNLDAVHVENDASPWCVIHDETYDSYEKAMRFLATKVNVMGKNIDITDSEGSCHCKEGYWISSKLTRLADMTKDDRVIENKMPGKGSMITIDKDGSKGGYLIVPFYKDENARPDSVRFQVRYFNKEIYAEKHKKIGGGTAVGGGSARGGGSASSEI